MPPNQVWTCGSTTGQQVNVINATILDTGRHDYPAPTCGRPRHRRRDLQFHADKNTPVRISVAPSQLERGGRALSRPRLPLLRSQAPTAGHGAAPNTNQAPATATTSPRGWPDPRPGIYTGDIGWRTPRPNVPTVDAAGRTWDRSDLNGGDASNMCNASPSGKDAFFSSRSAAQHQDGRVADSQTDFAHTLAVWKQHGPVHRAGRGHRRVRHARGRAEHADRQSVVLAAGQHHQPDAGRRHQGDQDRAGTDFQNTNAIQSLGTLAANTQIVTSGADTTGTAATYDNATLTCGAAPSAHDMIFKFHTNATGGATRLSVNNPSPAFPPVLALFDGTGGKVPQTGRGRESDADVDQRQRDAQPPPTTSDARHGRRSAYTERHLVVRRRTVRPRRSTTRRAMYGTATCSAGGTPRTPSSSSRCRVDANVRIQAAALDRIPAHDRDV